MILLNNPDKVDSRLVLLTRHLDRYGLRVNQKKVDIWTAAGLQQYRCQRFRLDLPKGDNHNSVLVKKFGDDVLAIPTSDLKYMESRPAAP